MDKPKPQSRGPFYNYNQVIHYIEWKYNIVTRGYTPKNGFTEKQLAKMANWQEKPYLDFWHWVCDMNEVHNGGSIYLDLTPSENEGGDDEYNPDWVREILGMISAEFQPEGGDMQLWVEW